MRREGVLELQIPDDVLEHARRSGISIEEFRKSLELFGTMQLISETSRLSMKGAGAISEKIKEKSWLRTAKRLNL
jgi:hypothetical protein